MLVLVMDTLTSMCVLCTDGAIVDSYNLNNNNRILIKNSFMNTCRTDITLLQYCKVFTQTV